MKAIYGRWMDNWERKLATRDTNRVARPFDWGADWLHSCGFPAFPVGANSDAAAHVSRFATEALADSDRFFAYSPVTGYELKGSRLCFPSPVQTRYPENNTAHAL